MHKFQTLSQCQKHSGFCGQLHLVADQAPAYLSVQDVQPPVGNRCYCCIALLKAVPCQELLKNLCLEHFDQLQLTTALQGTKKPLISKAKKPVCKGVMVVALLQRFHQNRFAYAYWTNCAAGDINIFI
jgi:hypothetical protein